MVAELKGTQWVKAPIGDHANHIENVNGYLKRKALCALRDLSKQGIAIPKHLISMCYEHFAQLPVHIPSSKLGGGLSRLLRE